MVGVTTVMIASMDSTFALHFGDVSTLLAGLFALVGCSGAARRHGSGRKGWALLTTAIAIWVTAQAVWTFEGFYRGHIGGNLSLADIGFLGYSVPAIAALIAFQRDSIQLVTRLRGFVDALVIGTSVLFCSWVIVLGPAIESGSAGLWTSVVGLAYPLVDAAVTSLVLFLAMRQPAGARLPWALLACGLVTLTATDTSYLSLATSGRLVHLGTVVTVGWTAAMLLVALAAYAPTRTSGATRVRYLTPGQELVPYLPVGLAVVCAAQVKVFADPFLLWGGAVVMILVGVRQVMIIAEKQALSNELESRVKARTVELLHAQDDLRQSFDNAPVGMLWTTLGGVIVQVNTVFCGMLGRTEDELVGSNVREVTSSADSTAGPEAMSGAVSASALLHSTPVESRYLHRNGAEVWAEVSRFVTKDVTGAPRYVVAQVQDITGKRAAARALANQSTFLEAVLENLDSGVVACDPDGRLTIINRALRGFNGISPAADTDLASWGTGFDLYHAGGVVPMTTHETPLIRALTGEQVHNAELVMALQDGTRRIMIADGHAIQDGDGELLGAVITMHDVTDRRTAEAALHRQALHDPLTDLANRALLRDRLEHAIARQARQPVPLALLLMDLDGFKLVNDSLGHQAGDDVLITLAGRLRSCLRADDTIARLGGDEFAVVLENTSESEAIEIAGHILAVVRQPVIIQGRPIASDASIGIMISTAVDSPESLLRNADLAMYAAKDSGKGNVQVFKAAMHDTVLERLTLDAELREAITRHQFTIAYQPIVSLHRARLRGFEALVRWTHPDRGVISPATFIPLAEATGLIVPLGKWVLREACRQMAQWRRTVPGSEELTMSVNLSVRQLQDPAILQVVAGALADSSLPAEYLQLEITESVFEHRGHVVIAMLDQLHASGVRLVVDDFGTGYSSLSRLHSLPVDKVKIDKSFVDLLGGGRPAPMVAATIAMAHSLGLEAVAEGVETADQLPFLLLHHCDAAQGFLFGRPIPGAEMEALLRDPASAARWAGEVSVPPGRAVERS